MEETKKQTITKENNSEGALSEFGITDVSPKPELSMHEQPLLLEKTPEFVSYATYLENFTKEPVFVMKDGTNIFRSIWQVVHNVELKNTEIVYDKKEERFDKWCDKKTQAQRGDHVIKMKDGTIVLSEYMDKTGKWESVHMGQTYRKGAYMKKTYPGKTIIVMAIAGKITDDFKNEIDDMNKVEEQLETKLRYIPVEIQFQKEPMNKLRVKCEIPQRHKILFKKLIGTSTKANKPRKQKDFTVIDKAIDADKYNVEIWQDHATVSIKDIKINKDVKINFEPINLNAIKLFVSKPTLQNHPALNDTFAKCAKLYEGVKQQDGLRFNNDIEKNDERISETIKRIEKTINPSK